VLEQELGENDEFCVAAKIDTRVLSELGLLQRLPLWRAALAKGTFAETELIVKSAEPNETSNASPPGTANQLPGPITPTRTATSSSDQEMWAAHAVGARQKRWVYAGVVAALVLLLGSWIGR